MTDLFASRQALFPVSTALVRGPYGSRLSLAGCDLNSLAAEYGTPLYLYDQASLDTAIQAYQQVLKSHYRPSSGITYAAKAFLCTAIGQWALKHNLQIDCSGQGELQIAHHAGASPAKLVAHGVSKTMADLDAAYKLAGTIVIENLAELDKLVGLLRRPATEKTRLWLRVRPGLTVSAHQHIQTGDEQSKFGLDWEEAAQAVAICIANRLPLTGLHFHLGSMLRDLAPIGQAIEATLDFIARMARLHDWQPQVFCPGGGLGVAYHENDLPHPNVERYVQYIARRLSTGCKKRRLPLPHVQLEPGRSLVARAGVALYQVQYVKHAGNRRWLLLDGGLADNPRPALYGARYTALPVRDPERRPTNPAWLGGPYCESGDVLIGGIPLPEVEPGELIAIPMSGAYQLSMSSNYNGALRPAVLWINRGQAALIQRREQPEDLSSLDIPLPPAWSQ